MKFTEAQQQSFTEFIATSVIPKVKGKPKTFLGISKQPHYENVLSNIYAFFFNANEVHRMHDLFIKSLVACIAKSDLDHKEFGNFDDFKIETEYTTEGNEKGKGRIDLLLYNSTAAIIIENKVYHHLNNDLDDYWKSVKLETDATSSKIGIILSLKPVSKDNYKAFAHKEEYINITHLELMKKVMEKSTSYLENANPKFIVFLEDFNQNIQNMSRSYLEKKDLEFYLDHQQKINELTKFNEEVYKHLVNEIEIAGEAIEDVDLNSLRKTQFNNSRLRYYVSKVHPDLMITVLFEDLLTEKKELHIIIELKHSLLKADMKNLFLSQEFTSEEQERLNSDFSESKNTFWAHFASNRYVLNADNLENLSSFIDTHLREDHLLSIFRKLEFSK
jgi:hypothetical protein